MKESVARLEYGNHRIGTIVDRFWLDGPLEISAIEQTQFLARLLLGRLPYRPENVAAVKEITVLEKLGEYEVHGKTGWCTSSNPDIGWWVGWLEKNGELTASFALNIDVLDEKADIAKRVPIGRACLQALGYK
jgi:beta-lactamase class D